MENMVVVNQEAGWIQCDFEAVKERLQRRLDEYRGAFFCEESKAAAKKEVASLRKEKKEFSDRIRQVKEAYMKPYVMFESRAKELLVLYDEPINLIDGQVKEFEERRREERRTLIQSIHQEEAASLSEYLPLDRIYDPRWENATTKEREIRAAIAGMVTTVERDISAIQSMQSEAEQQAFEVYKRGLSLSDAMTYLSNYERQKAEIMQREQERQRREEADRIRREERERIAAEQRAQEERDKAVEQARKEAAQETIESLIPEDVNGAATWLTYQLQLTEEQKEKLEIYLDSVGIEWELV